VLVDGGVADVHEAVAVEPAAHGVEMVLVAHEVDRDAVSLPKLLLIAERAVGGAAHDVAELDRPPDERERDGPRRVAGLEGAVDVEADEDQGMSLGAYSP
jgi:hypothetical protein